MTVTVRALVPSKLAENVQTTQYTAVNCKAIIDKFTVTNTSAANISFSINLVTSGDVAGANNLVLKTRGIAPGETYTTPEMVGQLIESGGFISTLSSAASAAVLRVSGREIT